jgi:myo-inositol catabolism protein IolS
MMTRSCGRSGLRLPILGIGCWSFGGGDYWGEQDQTDVDSIVAAALDMGCNYFDTAEVYNDGRSEIALGAALKGCRTKAIIGSKVSPDNTHPAALRSHCEASLRRLNTDYIDLYMVHWPINPVSLKHYTNKEVSTDSLPDTRAAFETLAALKQEGKIRHVGVSNFGPRQIAEINDYEIVANELCYNLLCRGLEYEIMPVCSTSGIGIIGYMPLMQGILTGKYPSLKEIPWQRARSRHFSGRREGSRHGEEGFEALLEETLESLRGMSVQSGIPPARLALAWSMTNPSITCTVNGVRSVTQLEDNMEAASEELSEELLNALVEATNGLKEAMGPYADIYEGKEKSRTF